MRDRMQLMPWATVRARMTRSNKMEYNPKVQDNRK